MNIDPARLLEAIRKPIMRGRNAELRCVASGKKGLSAVVFTESEIETNYKQYRAHVERALKLSLVVTQVQIRAGCSGEYADARHVLVTRPDQCWRIPAYLIMIEALDKYSWSDSSEFAFSKVLGYSDKEAHDYMAMLRHARAAWRGMTMYFAMTAAQHRSLLSYGTNMFNPALRGAVTVFASYKGQVLKRNAHRLVPKRVIICRASIQPAAVRRILGDCEDNGIFCRTVRAQVLQSLNGALESKIQTYTHDGWT